MRGADLASAEASNRVTESLSVGRTFGAAFEEDGLVIIPVALVARGGGGEGMAERALHETASPVGKPSSGSGGGFGIPILPTGAYVARDGHVRFVSAIDITMVVLAFLGLVRLLTSARGRSRTRREITERAIRLQGLRR